MILYRYSISLNTSIVHTDTDTDTHTHTINAHVRFAPTYNPQPYSSMLAVGLSLTTMLISCIANGNILLSLPNWHAENLWTVIRIKLLPSTNVGFVYRRELTYLTTKRHKVLGEAAQCVLCQAYNSNKRLFSKLYAFSLLNSGFCIVYQSMINKHL